jgi:hypothetical protein
MDPPEPLDADPLPRYKEPLLPELEVPELNTIDPLTPSKPAFELIISTDPLEVSLPYPLRMICRPPDEDEDRPDDK